MKSQLASLNSIAIEKRCSSFGGKDNGLLTLLKLAGFLLEWS